MPDWVRYSGNKKVWCDERDSCRSHSFTVSLSSSFSFPSAVCPASSSSFLLPLPRITQKRIDSYWDQECIDVMPPFVESKCSIIREIGSFFIFLRRLIFLGPTRPWNGCAKDTLIVAEKRWTNRIERNLAKVNL